MEDITFNKPFTAEQQQWIAEQDAISRQESLTMALEEQTEAMKAQTRVLEELMMQVKNLADVVDSKETVADLRCDFTGWNLVEAISNLAATKK